MRVVEQPAQLRLLLSLSNFNYFLNINSILQVLITVFTLGIGLPRAVCIKEKWVADHTIIDGK